jgi:hypothetical protein
LNSVEIIENGKPNAARGVSRFSHSLTLGKRPSQPPRIRATSATRPLPQVWQRPSTASKKSACRTGRTGLTGRKDRANDRCLFFAGRQVVSNPTRDSSVAILDPSLEPTSIAQTPERTSDPLSYLSEKVQGSDATCRRHSFQAAASLRQAATRLEEEPYRSAPLHAKRRSRGN